MLLFSQLELVETKNMTDKNVETISINNIVVNNENARHGKLETEKDAILWLLSNNSSRLEALAKDIAKEGKLYERPLVKKENDKYIVYDGNRRITCLKLLNNPNYIGNTVWSSFFETLKKNNDNIPNKIECDVSNDIQYINELVERRHVGGDTGKGQLKWNREQKENHLILTGQKKVLDFTVFLQDEMKKEGLLGEAETLEHSLIKRLFSSNAFRKKIGFILEDEKVSYIIDRMDVLKILLRIHNDMAEGKETLHTLWNNKDKERYLKKLEDEGILPQTPKENAKSSQNSKTTVVNPRKKVSFPSIIDTDFPIEAKTNEEIKIKAIWDEMQYRLKCSTHPYSLGVMMRVLLELATDYCLPKTNSLKDKSDHLNQKMMDVVGFFEKEKILNKSDSNNLKGTATVDINRLHAFVHNLNAHPTPQELISLWGKYKNYIINCLMYK